ncbi:MAG: non-canonical purine NTP pyrophosphatase [Myxococcales bacterium]|nr:non-canonical purine NTP pyrophosphatase [Myxococcales bacterium]MCB9525661.1 non-canonical purine NTP pyrophosphatase [Myxococcales bacterium]
MKPDRARLLIATGNPHKLDEFRALLPGLPLVGLDDFPPGPEVIESAPDFAGNAIIKAVAAYEHTGLISLADDSGIAVDALDGAPGVLSARYAPGSDRDRLNALLAAMADYPEAAERTARFVCVIAIAGLPADLPLPEGLSRRDGCVIGRGVVEGTLTHGPRGEGGFGYDPIFELPDGRTSAELTAREKHAVSHRGRAARAVAPLLSAFFS